MSSHSEIPHSRVQFQIDRVAFFSDAVIAIALTLMILEIKIPELGKDMNFNQLINQYGITLFLHTLALLVGFLTIGNLWIRHHELFEHIINYNERLVRINLYFLLTVVMLPVSISFLFASNQPQHLQLLFYFLNLFLCSASFSLMVLTIYNRKNQFSSIKEARKIKEIKNNSLIGTYAFLIVTILIILNFSWYYVAFLIIPVYRIIEKRKKAKLKIKHAQL